MRSDTSSIPHFGTGSELTVNDKLKNVEPLLRHVLNSLLQMHLLLSGTGEVFLRPLLTVAVSLAPHLPSHGEDDVRAAQPSNHASLGGAVICNTPKFGWHFRDHR